MTRLNRLSPASWWWFAVVLTALKLFLTRSQPVFALGIAAHDDRLFLELAEQLAQGRWLGDYNQMTLAKGPFYSLWIAGTNLLGLPLSLSQQLLYAAACAALVQAFAPLLRSCLVRTALFALLLANPMSYDAASLGRILRQQVYTPLGMLVLAGIAALYFRRAESLRRQAPWAILLGASSGAFWLTREEGIWLAPSVVMLTAALGWGMWRGSLAQALRIGGSLALAGSMAVALLGAVCTMNYRHYRWFGTVEFRASEFQDAYGALLRIRPAHPLPFVPITRSARLAAYQVSPAFAELRPYLEGPIGAGWAQASATVTGRPAEELEIGGGWIVWALRDAVAAAGHCRDAAEALRFYRRMADEINQACDTGRLPAGPPRSGFTPDLSAINPETLAQTFLDFAGYTLHYRNFSALAPPSVGDAASLDLFRRMTRDRLSPPDHTGESASVPPALNLLDAMGRALTPVLFWLFVITQALWLLRLLQLVFSRTWSYSFLFATAVWMGGAIYLAMTALIQVTSYPIMTVSSFASVYPLQLLFSGIVACECWVAWTQRPPLSAGTPAAQPAETTPSRHVPGWTWLAGGVALLPFIIWQGLFARLFWFGDEYMLLDQIAQSGIGNWSLEAFSENFVPLFKLLWGGQVLAFHGSYLGMLAVLWLTHAVNTVCLGRILARSGFGPWSIALTQVVFALTPVNLESLGWSVQWSAVLASTFLLLALLWSERLALRAQASSWRGLLPLCLLVAASACSFSRGVLTGFILAIAQLLDVPGTSWLRPRWPRHLPAAVLCLLPAAAVTGIIIVFSPGDHHTLGSHLFATLRFAATYYFLNPLLPLLGLDPLQPAWVLLAGLAKAALVAWGLYRSEGRVRRLLFLLLCFDLGNSALLGIGRAHTGYLAALSSRYQYGALIAFLPFLGLAMEHSLSHLGLAPTGRRNLAALVLASAAGCCLLTWPATLRPFVSWRGSEVRSLMQAPATKDPAAKVPALDFMHVERAKALIRTFRLH